MDERSGNRVSEHAGNEPRLDRCVICGTPTLGWRRLARRGFERICSQMSCRNTIPDAVDNPTP